MEKEKLGARTWISILMFGFLGQIAWVIENMYFNVFLYNHIGGDADSIAWMVAASAAVATLTTMFMGALSDKVGKRKIFIAVGYIFWGLSTMAFGLISIENIQALLPSVNAISVGIVVVIVMDCVMTFFGSTANDSAFNAWITDTTNENNRGKVETILGTLPLIALLVIFGFFAGLTDETTGNWPLFFYIIGGMVTVGGIVGLFLIKKEAKTEAPKEKYLKTFIYGFRPSTVKANPLLYVFLVITALSGIASQVYMPYFIIYFTKYLHIDNYALLLGLVILGASVASIVVGRFINAKNKNKFFIPSLAANVIGFVALFFSRNQIAVGISGFVMMAGSLVFGAAVGAKTRDYTPKDKAGHFQGIRMIFSVLIPMIVGPAIGSAIIMSNPDTYIDLGSLHHVPTPYIFLAAAAISLTIIIPLLFTLKKEKAVTIVSK